LHDPFDDDALTPHGYSHGWDVNRT
jgi:hypothetical protein